MSGGEIVLFVFFLIVALFIFIMLFGRKSKEEIDCDNKLKESLEEEYIIDPETQAKLTLEQAQSGIWNPDEVTYYSESDVENHYSDEFQKIKKAQFYLEKQESYTESELNEEDIELLNQIVLLSKYYDCNFTNIFTNNSTQTKIIFSWVEAEEIKGYSGIQLLFWVRIQNFNGHYFLSEKTKSERFALKLATKEALFFNDYYCEILKKSFSNEYEIGILEKCAAIQRIEVEILNDNLFIKTTDLASIEDIVKIEELLVSLPI